MFQGASAAVRKFIGRHGPAISNTAKNVGKALFSSAPLHNIPGNNPIINTVKTVGNMGREAIFGNPIDLAQQIKNKGVGSVVKNHFFPTLVSPNTVNKELGFGNSSKLKSVINTGRAALALGIPAYQLASAVSAPPEQRGSTVGGTLANIAVSPFTSMLGVPGQRLADKATMLGARLGQRFNQKNEYDYHR
jgi:hypothetical protein